MHGHACRSSGGPRCTPTGIYWALPMRGRHLSEELAPAIPSNYSRKMNQMGSTQDTGIILVRACGALHLVGSSFSLYSYARL
jgi:hypothetical protein